MKARTPLAVLALLALVCVAFYYISSVKWAGMSNFGLVNSVGLVSVVVGIVAAGIILRRAAPPARSAGQQVLGARP